MTLSPPKNNIRQYAYDNRRDKEIGRDKRYHIWVRASTGEMVKNSSPSQRPRNLAEKSGQKKNTGGVSASPIRKSTKTTQPGIFDFLVGEPSLGSRLALSVNGM